MALRPCPRRRPTSTLLRYCASPERENDRVGFFKKLLRQEDPNGSPQSQAGQTPPLMADGLGATLYNGGEVLEVVGESHRQENLWAIVGREPDHERVYHQCTAILVAEASNPYDANAISVWVDGLLVGYLSREDAAKYRPGILKLAEKGPVALSGEIVGGGPYGEEMLGVFLNHDPADFDPDRNTRRVEAKRARSRC